MDIGFSKIDLLRTAENETNANQWIDYLFRCNLISEAQFFDSNTTHNCDDGSVTEEVLRQDRAVAEDA